MRQGSASQLTAQHIRLLTWTVAHGRPQTGTENIGRDIGQVRPVAMLRDGGRKKNFAARDRFSARRGYVGYRTGVRGEGWNGRRIPAALAGADRGRDLRPAAGHPRD